MKNLLFILLLVIVANVISCSSVKKNQSREQNVELIAEDSLEYQIIVLDVKYETFLAMQPSENFYSQSYYEGWNRQYVVEWNIRHNNPLRFGSFYATEINYHPNIDYGLTLNYRLYNYFIFIEKEYGIRLINRGR